MYCKKCGSILDFSDRICNNCGEPVERAEGKVVGHRMKQDVKILQSTKKQKDEEKFKWDVKDFPSEKTKKTDDLVLNWGNGNHKNIKGGLNSNTKENLDKQQVEGKEGLPGMKLFSDSYASPFQLSKNDTKIKEEEKNIDQLDKSIAGMSLYAKDVVSPLKAPEKTVDNNKKVAGMRLFVESVGSPLHASKRGAKPDTGQPQLQDEGAHEPALKWTDTRPYRPLRKAEVKARQDKLPQKNLANSIQQENKDQVQTPANGDRPEAYPKDVAITKKPIDFPFDEEVKEPVLEEKKEKSGSGKVVLVILIILLLLGGGAFVISKYLPESIAGQWINGIFGIENIDSEDQGLIDKETVVSSQLFNNQNIGEVVADEALIFDENKMYSLDGLNDSKPIARPDLEIYEKAVGAVIKHCSDWVAYLNDGEQEVLSSVKIGSPMESHVLNYEKKGQVQIEFKKLKIGEVRQGGQGYYVWVREHTVLNDGISQDESEIERIYFLQEENNSLVISNFQ